MLSHTKQQNIIIWIKVTHKHILISGDFSETDILQTINSQGSNGHDIISILVLKPCGETICRPLNIILKTCLNTGKFSSEWKKSNVVPIHKKIWQAKFPGDSCINQLISINYEILNAFDKGHGVWGIFLDIWRAFDKVCRMVLFLNCVKMIKTEISSTFYETFFGTEIK